MIGGLFVRSKLVLAIGIALMASACTKKAEGQTVAIVNGEEITAAELNAELANAKIPEGADKDQARSRVLQAMIDRRLLAQQAKTDGIDKSPEFLNRQRRATEDLLINMFASRQIDTAKLPANSEIEKFQATRPWIFSQREQWNLDQLRFQMPTDAATRAKLEKAKTHGGGRKGADRRQHRFHPAEEQARYGGDSGRISTASSRPPRARPSPSSFPSGIRPSPARSSRASPRRSRVSKRVRSPWPRCAASRRPN